MSAALKLWDIDRIPDPNNHTTTFAYNARNELIGVIDHQGNATSFAYDAKGRKISETRPSILGTSAVIQTTLYTYDLVDRLIREEHLAPSGGASRVIEYSYDNLDRRISRTISDGTSSEESTYSYSPQLDAELTFT